MQVVRQNNVTTFLLSVFLLLRGLFVVCSSVMLFSQYEFIRSPVNSICSRYLRLFPKW
jgi:hypothetical protein